MNKELNDKLFDDVLVYALEQECERTGDALSSEGELSKNISVSPEFEKKMNTLFNKEKKKVRKKYIWNITKKIAACVAVVLILNTILLIGVQAYRVQFLNMCIDVKDDFTTFFFEDKVDNEAIGLSQIPSDWKDVYLLTYVPDGFLITGVSDSGDIKRIILSNEVTKQIINFSYSPTKNSTFSVDTEEANTRKIDILGNAGYISEKSIAGEKRTSIVFKNDTLVFSLIVPFDQKTSVRIAENIKKIR